MLSTLISPAFHRRRRDWVDVGAVDDLSSGHPKQLDHVTTIRDGWLETTSHKAVWAVKQAQGDIKVFSPICTHLGCGYRWDETDKNSSVPVMGVRMT